MSPSAKELDLEIGDTATVHRRGSKKLNDFYNLGSEEGGEVLIVDPEKTGCRLKPGQLVGRLEKTGVDFVLDPDWDLFLKI